MKKLLFCLPSKLINEELLAIHICGLKISKYLNFKYWVKEMSLKAENHSFNVLEEYLTQEYNQMLGSGLLYTVTVLNMDYCINLLGSREWAILGSLILVLLNLPLGRITVLLQRIIHLVGTQNFLRN